MDETTLSIGEVAARTGVPVSTIRFYERRGMLPMVERVAGRRRFGRAAIRRLEVIVIAKRAGLALAEIADLLGGTERGTPAYVRLRGLAADKLPEVEAQIEQAVATRDWLNAAASCGCESLEECALFAGSAG